MKASRTDGKIVTLRIGEAICGYGFYWVKIEPKDKELLYSESEHERKCAREWIEHVLGQRLVKKPKKK